MSKHKKRKKRPALKQEDPEMAENEREIPAAEALGAGEAPMPFGLGRVISRLPGLKGRGNASVSLSASEMEEEMQEAKPEIKSMGALSRSEETKEAAGGGALQPESKEKGRNRRDVVTESLSAIYEGKPSREWMKTLDRGRRKTWRIIFGSFVLVVLVGLGTVWAGFSWFGNRGFDGNGISIQIEGPAEATIGQETSYYVNWFNTAKEPLAAVEFRVSVPGDFVVAEVLPSPTDALLALPGEAAAVPKTFLFRLGAQPTEGHGTLKIKGRFTGALSTKSAIQVIATYRPASFNSEFEALETKEIVYTRSILAGELFAPEKVVPGDEVVIRYAITNIGSDSMSDIFARFTLPDGFIPASGTAAVPETGELTVPVGILVAGASSTVELRGTFANGAHGDQFIRADAGLVVADGAFASAQSSEASVSVLTGDLKIDLIVNGSQADRSANPGEIQRISVGYMNTSDEVLKDVVFTFHFAGVRSSSTKEVAGADWSRLEDAQEGERAGNTLTFTKEEVKALAELAPNAAGTISFSVPLSEKVSPEEDVSLFASVEARIGSVGGAKTTRVVRTTPMTIRMRSDAAISSLAWYASDEGIQLGSGPLPPVVGQATTYRIEWLITKTFHELSRLTVSATLPPGVRFGSVKEVGAGDAGYDPDKNLVTWQVNRMPEDIGDLLCSFDVILSPSSADVGRFAPLLGETQFEFIDSAINERILRTAPPQTTELPDDALAKRKGVVEAGD